MAVTTQDLPIDAGPSAATPEAGRNPGPSSARRRVLTAAWYGLLAVLVVPVVSPGYLLLLDWVPTPSMGWSAAGPFGVHDAPTDLLLQGLATVAPAWLLQRGILLFAVWGAGMAAHVTAPVRRLETRFFAGALYALSPVVFTRILAGHWHLLVAYALLPLAVRAIVRLAERPSRRQGLVAGGWIAGVGLVSAHAAVLVVLVLAIAAVVGLVWSRDRRRVLVDFAWATGVMLAGTLWWVIPAALHPVPRGGGVEALDAFATSAAPGTSTALSIAGLRGFWIGRYDSQDPSFWPLVAVLVVALTMLGFVARVLDGRRTASLVALGSAAACALVALGVASPVTAPLFRWLYRSVPGALLLREPQKAVILLALVYAWFGAAGMEWLRDRGEVLVRTLAIAALALSLLLGPALFGGLGGRIDPVRYPASWERAETIMASDPDRFSVLSLPWQLYAPLPWNDPAEPVANPAPGYFSRPVLASDDPQLVAGPEGSASEVDRTVRGLLARADDTRQFGAGVASFDVKYVVLLSGGGSGASHFLFNQTDLEPVVVSPELVLFRNTAWRP